MSTTQEDGAQEEELILVDANDPKTSGIKPKELSTGSKNFYGHKRSLLSYLSGMKIAHPGSRIFAAYQSPYSRSVYIITNNLGAHDTALKELFVESCARRSSREIEAVLGSEIAKVVADFPGGPVAAARLLERAFELLVSAGLLGHKHAEDCRQFLTEAGDYEGLLKVGALKKGRSAAASKLSTGQAAAGGSAQRTDVADEGEEATSPLRPPQCTTAAGGNAAQRQQPRQTGRQQQQQAQGAAAPDTAPPVHSQPPPALVAAAGVAATSSGGRGGAGAGQQQQQQQLAQVPATASSVPLLHPSRPSPADVAAAAGAGNGGSSSVGAGQQQQQAQGTAAVGSAPPARSPLPTAAGAGSVGSRGRDNDVAEKQQQQGQRVRAKRRRILVESSDEDEEPPEAEPSAAEPSAAGRSKRVRTQTSKAAASAEQEAAFRGIESKGKRDVLKSMPEEQVGFALRIVLVLRGRGLAC